MKRIFTCLLIGLLAALAGCTSNGVLNNPDYHAAQDGTVIARSESKIGRHHLDKLMREDKMVRDYIRRNGEPEFVYMLDDRRLELVYVAKDEVLYFGNVWFQNECGLIEHTPHVPEKLLARISLIDEAAAQVQVASR